MIIPSPANIARFLKYYDFFRHPPDHHYEGEDDPDLIDPYIYSFEVFQLVNKLYMEHFIQEFNKSPHLPEDLEKADICSLVEVFSGVVMADRYSPGFLSEFIAQGNLRKLVKRLKIIQKETQDRMYGSLLGLAVGDALGAPVEFNAPGSFKEVTGFREGGSHNLKAGEWSDDTSLALALAKSLIDSKGFDPQDQMERYLAWYQEGYLSVNGECFDIGNTTREALEHFADTQEPYSGPDHKYSAGNGSLMRIAPIPIYFFSKKEEVLKYARLSSCTTHKHPLVVECCTYFAHLLWRALLGEDKDKLLSPDNHPFTDEINLELKEVIKGSYKTKNPPQIKARGYVVLSLEAALWAFYNSDNFKSGALLAVNLGDDADTVGAIYGQLAGAYYGKKSIPLEWLDKLACYDFIMDLSQKLVYHKEW
ncbi:MAG: ADP-ribosylglycohydrolase family protein [Euryarchaeota archaeon]